MKYRRARAAHYTIVKPSDLEDLVASLCHYEHRNYRRFYQYEMPAHFGPMVNNMYQGKPRQPTDDDADLRYLLKWLEDTNNT